MEINLYPHQRQSLNETKNFNRVAYYHDMGLGKTFTGSEKMKQLNTPYNLLICQKSKIDDWAEHFKTYYDYKIITYNKPVPIPEHSIVIINYDLIWRRPKLSQLENFTLMLDESSYIKNEMAKRTKFILNKLKPDNVILLSGTPTGGKYEELWSQCHLLGWKISKNLYWRQYIETEIQEIGGFPIKIVTGYKNVDRLKKKLRDHGAVFLKTDEVMTLPEQIETIVPIRNTKDYRRFKQHRIIDIDGKTLVGDTSLTKLLYLRQLAGQYNPNKLDRARELLESTNDRVIIFYNFNKEMELISNICRELEKPTSIISGPVKDLTNYETKSNAITLVQYQAGALGVNLQKSNKVIYYTLPLSSELFEQSKKRIHRIGQDRTCFYWYLLTTGTIEHKIYETLKMRKDFTDRLFEELEAC